jgi:hypothetical protein
MSYEEKTATEKMRLFFAHGAGTYLSKVLAQTRGVLLDQALAEARAEGYAQAREDAARLMQGGHSPPCYERPTPTGTTVGECGNCNRARIIRGLQFPGFGYHHGMVSHRELAKALRDVTSTAKARATTERQDSLAGAVEATCSAIARAFGVDMNNAGEDCDLIVGAGCMCPEKTS